MNMDSKSLPFIAGLVVLGAAGAFVLMTSSGTSNRTTPDVPAVAVELHAKQVEARTAIREGRLDDATDLLRSIPKDDPSYIAALGDLGILYEQTDDPISALATANELLDHQPEDSNAHFVACRAKYMMGEYDVAEFACMRAIEIAPRNALARYSVALARLAQGKLDQSIDSYLRAMDIDANESRIVDALSDVTELSESKPELAAAQYVLAFFANSLNDKVKEREHLQRFLDLEPTGDLSVTVREKLESITN